MKRIIWILSLILALGIGIWGTYQWMKPVDTHRTIHTQSVMQQVKDVFQLITVQGQFSEIYDYEDFYYYDWAPFRKKALVKVQATVSYGYDMEQVGIQVDEVNKRIRIDHLPQPDILALDIQPQYYDIREGSFNSFHAGDYNRIQQDIRALVISDANHSELPKRARQQLTYWLETTSSLLLQYGWQVEWDRGDQKIESSPKLPS